MKILRIIGSVLLAMIVAMSFRFVIRRYFPRAHDAVWGQRYAPKEDKVTPVLVEPPKVPPGELQKQQTEKEEPLYMTGKLWTPDGKVIVVMSDGTVRSVEDNTEPDKPRVERIMRRFMDFQGRRYYLMPRPALQTANQSIPATGTPPAKREILEEKEDVKKVLKEPEKEELAQKRIVPPG